MVCLSQQSVYLTLGWQLNHRVRLGKRFRGEIRRSMAGMVRDIKPCDVIWRDLCSICLEGKIFKDRIPWDYNDFFFGCEMNLGSVEREF